MTDQELMERIETQAAEISSLKEQLSQAVQTCEKLAELEGRENELTDENDALRRALAEEDEMIRNMTKPINEIGEKLADITAAARRVDVEAIDNINARLDALTKTAADTESKLRSLPSAIRMNWIICVLCIVATAAGLWHCSTQAKQAADAARQAVWGIYTRPDGQGRSHSAIEWSADWQAWYESQAKQ